ncbi:DNA polymerase III subunit epsilon [Acinetobacter sp. YH12116]|uniref:DNA polymerase III subunit epsilon n=1 Tax=Acinetobacter sp. YH12116 TaxID=2601103 RepID=UPI0015D2AE31|nr:DNA polymerase III subunit epsilon [Acinetobacter sp. YH12116]
MSQTITLYVDGACRGNPGLGGWGAYVITETQQHKLYGGELETTNNRMELTAAIEGIQFCPAEAKLILWTDSNYVKRGITEWIAGWKKKNWKDVKNPDLWQKLDAICQGRELEWHWIKGHAGHAGNEMADQLANKGADLVFAQQVKVTPVQIITEDKSAESEVIPPGTAKKKAESDWLLDDPFGFDLDDSQLDVEVEEELLMVQEDHLSLTQHSITVTQTLSQNDSPNQNEVLIQDETQNQSATAPANTSSHPHIVITPATVQAYGPRQLILDTETTGFYYQDGDRIIEVGAIEMVNRKLTGSSIHIYINPEKPVGESEVVHGISDEFLKDKPKYAEIAAVLYDYLKGAEIIAHNATFDMNFLDMEFNHCGLGDLSAVCEVTDTLVMAKNKHPGQKNSLDALVKRYEIPARDRTFHGALLDAEILADVYLAMTGGQVSFDMDALSAHHEEQSGESGRRSIEVELPVILPSAAELEAHENWVKQFEEKHGQPCFFAK